jgi:hypothetical protein
MGFIVVLVIPPHPPLASFSCRRQAKGGLEGFEKNLTESHEVVKWKSEDSSECGVPPELCKVQGSHAPNVVHGGVYGE